MRNALGLLRRRGRSRAPLAIASFIAIPLFFSSLMASTLALEKPRVIQWTTAGHLRTVYFDPSTATELRIWLWALVPPAVLIVTGWIATRLPYGFYVSCVAAIVIAMAVVHDLNKWTVHHTLRFPPGVDLIPASDPASNQFDPGQWELMARETALSLSHWTIGLALISMLIVGGLALKRRYYGRRPGLDFTPLDGVHSPSATLPGLGDDTP